MKRFLSVLLSVCCAFALALPALADEAPIDEKNYTIQIGLEKQELDLSGLPCQPYCEGGTLMVPLRLIAEALGYQVGWEADSGAVTVDDEYIQKATLYNGTAEAVFASHLKAIDMSRTIDNAAPTAIHNGCTYVPLAFFAEFLNDVSEENGVILIAPSMCELAAESGSAISSH